MGGRPAVERAFSSALLRIGIEGMADAVRCRSELTRLCGQSAADVDADLAAAVALASTGAHLVDVSGDGASPLDEKAVAAVLAAHGVTGADAEWVRVLWSPVLVHQRAPNTSVPGTARSRRHNLRPQLTTFLGRHSELGALPELLGRTRLLTVVGPGGVGKTRLAIEVAAAVVNNYPDGVWMTELAPVDKGSDVVDPIATTLGVRERGADTTLDAVVDWLHPRTILLLLDNCEHVVGRVRAFVDRVLHECPAVTLLLTSREVLGLDGERHWLTKPLALPAPAVTGPAEASRFEAIELFVQRATTAHPDFALTVDNVGDVAEICRRLDGMPLALELAAARLQALGPVELLEHLDERFRLLAGRTREPRQTLRGTVDWSYGLLDEVEGLLFRRLTVFAGSWSLDACRSVCSGGALRRADVVDVLAGLVSKSLVAAELRPSGTRYRMLETLRHYGQERLDELGEGDEVRRAHALWARALVEGSAPGLRGRHERAYGDLIREELDNLRVALRWAITNADAEIAFGIIAPLEDYAILRLDYEVAAWAEQVLATPAWADHPLRHLALGLVAHAAWARGDHDRARQLGLEALASERRHRSVPSWTALLAAGNAAWFQGRLEQAMEGFIEWVERAREVGDDFQLSLALAHLSVATSFADRSAASGALVDEALVLARRSDSPFLIALVLYAKSERMIDDDPPTAMKLLEEGVAVGRDSGNRFSYGLCLSTLASLTGRRGDPLAAARLYRSAVENWRVADNWSNQRILLRNLAEFAARIDEYELTARLLAVLEASGRMLTADIGPEGERLAQAVDRARQALGPDRYDEVAEEAARIHPVVLVRETLELLDLLGARLEVASGDSRTPPPRDDGGLSRREQEIVALVAGGLTNREVAGRLFISERTVDTHITRIRRKLGTTTRTQLALWGLEHVSAPRLAAAGGSDLSS